VFAGDCRDQAAGNVRIVTDREPTWFDFDCDYCTGVWDYTSRRGLFHRTWTVAGGVTSVLASLEAATAQSDRVTLAWRADASVTRAVLERAADAGAWKVLATLEPDDHGRLNYVDLGVAPGARYGYRLGIERAGAQQWLEPVWLEIPRATTFALRGARPNPAAKNLVVAFALPVTAPATLDIVDLGGRRVTSRRLDALDPGEHVVDLGPVAGMSPGVYWLRLTQEGRALTRRFVVAR
jgi:hypothetical protein